MPQALDAIVRELEEALDTKLKWLVYARENAPKLAVLIQVAAFNAELQAENERLKKELDKASDCLESLSTRNVGYLPNAPDWKARAEKAEADNVALREALLLASPNPGEKILAVVEAARALNNGQIENCGSASLRLREAVRDLDAEKGASDERRTKDQGSISGSRIDDDL